MTSQYQYSQSTFTQKFPNNDTFKFLVSTDTHLGYKETDNIRKNDSFEAFEEVLQKAKENNVDFVLLGGDLFHDLNPSQKSLYRCLTILKERIFGDKQIEYQTFWEDQAPNYSNENMNISLPIFIIHGNHDYPSDEYGNLSTLDLLHAGNYVNYFGKFTNYDNIDVRPIIFHKKGTKIALYGLGHIKDVRLHYLLLNGKVKFTQPEENPESYFHILVVHQNRPKGMKNWSYKNSIHPKMFPPFFNLIIWAHEHESIPDIVQSSEIQAYIYQPGSSIATSLIEAESKTKHAGLFTFRKNEFYFEPIYLTKTERPLIFKQLEVANLVKKKNLNENEMNEEIEKQIEVEIDGLLREFEKSQSQNSQTEKNKKLPLVRLKCEYSGFDIIRIQRLEAKFVGRVANEGDILKFWKKKKEVDEVAIENNENLTRRFSECFKNKVSFNTLGTEALTDIRLMYEEELKNNNFKILAPSIFLEKMDNINFRNRQSLLSDFFESGLKKVNSQIFQKEKQNISKMISEYNQSTDEKLKTLRMAIQNPQYASQILQEEALTKGRQLEGEIQNFVENLKKTVFSLTSTKINAIFKPENNFLEEKHENNQIPQKKSPNPAKNLKKSGKLDDFEEDRKSISTNISQNIVKPTEMTFNEEDNITAIDEDFMENEGSFIEKSKKPEKTPLYNINIFGATSQINQEKVPEKGKRGRKKKEKEEEKINEKPSNLEVPKKPKVASNQEKVQKPKIEEKKEETKSIDLKSFSYYNDFLNPKKRKEESNVVIKPEKKEKKEEKVMTAQTLLGALMENNKEGSSFKKQRVFNNSPLGSKAKKKSGAFNDLF